MSRETSIIEEMPQPNKAFTKWVSSQLSRQRSNYKVKDVTRDLSNGVALVELAEILAQKLAPRNWSLSPKSTDDMIYNNDLALEMFKNDGVDVEEITGKDITENNERLILELIWILILFYSIGVSIQFDSNFEDLLEWAIDRTKNYQNVDNFQPYYLSMCALIDSYHPDIIKYNSLDPNDKEHSSKLAISSMKELKIPAILDSDDLQSPQIDEKILLTQLALMKIKFENIRILKSATTTPIRQRLGIDIDQIQTRNIDFDQEFVEEEEEEAEIKARDINIEFEEEEAEIKARNIEIEFEEEEEVEAPPNQTNDAEFSPYRVPGDNMQYEGKKFGLMMTLSESDYNNGHKMNPNNDQNRQQNDREIHLALALSKHDNPYLNPSGRLLDLLPPNIEDDKYQQFTFGKKEWNTVIDSFAKKGMVWDVSDEENLNPPAGTPFYVFPFHGRHNQHFIYKDSMIYAQQNGHVVTYVGGDEPIVMMPPSEDLKARQTFVVQIL